jgi:hypothetical protein
LKRPKETDPWSCYTTSPQRSLEIFEEARAQCPVAHSEAHDGFYMLLDYDDVKRAIFSDAITPKTAGDYSFIPSLQGEFSPGNPESAALSRPIIRRSMQSTPQSGANQRSGENVVVPSGILSM